jgi:hypothetical protein
MSWAAGARQLECRVRGPKERAPYQRVPQSGDTPGPGHMAEPFDSMKSRRGADIPQHERGARGRLAAAAVTGSEVW